MSTFPLFVDMCRRCVHCIDKSSRRVDFVDASNFDAPISA